MTILRRAAPTRWLYPAILLLLFMEKSSAVEIAGYGGSASWTQIGATFESDGSDSPGMLLSFSQDGSRLLVGSSYGSVAVYEWQSGSSTWTQIGDNLIYPSHSASLSGDGNVVALGVVDSIRVRIGLDRPRVPLLRRLLATGRFQYRRAFVRGLYC